MTEAEEIKLCLNCQLPRCVNCIDEPSRKNRAKPHKRNYDLWKAQITELAAAGFTDGRIGETIGICSGTVAKLRKELGIPAHKRGGARTHGRKFT